MQHVIEQVEYEVNQKRLEFIILARLLANELNQAADELEKNNRPPNNLGVVQGKGPKLDILCAEYMMARLHLKWIQAAVSK